MSDTQRNFLILFAVAIGAYFAFEGFSMAASYIMLIMGVMFAICIAFFFYRWHVANKRKVRQMSFGWQALLYLCGAIVVLSMPIFLVFAYLGITQLAGYALLIGAIFGIYQCVQNMKRYW